MACEDCDKLQDDLSDLQREYDDLNEEKEAAEDKHKELMSDIEDIIYNLKQLLGRQ